MTKKKENPRAPREDKDFRKYWNKFIGVVITRDNYSNSHLENLKILCDLYCEIEKVKAQINEEGFTYESMSQSGLQIKPHPLMSIKQNMLAEIRQYSRLLGIVLSKDVTNNDPEPDSDFT